MEREQADGAQAIVGAKRSLRVDVRSQKNSMIMDGAKQLRARDERRSQESD